MAKKCARTDKSDTKMDTDGGGEAGTSQSYSRHNKRQMANIYLMDFMKDHKKLYDKTNEHFKLQAPV